MSTNGFPTPTEFPLESWKKRFFQTHYSYRDSLLVVTTPAVTSPGIYNFGANARAISKYNWPQMNDWPNSSNTYAREVWVYAAEDTYIQFICLNPRYLTYLNQMKVPPNDVQPTISEVPQFIPAGGSIKFNPTYGIGMAYWFSTKAGQLVVSIEGNAEGTE